MNNLTPYFRGIIDADEKPIVICNTEHTIIYMNTAAAKRYHKSGGAALVGKSILDCHNSHTQELIVSNVQAMKENKSLNKIFEFHKNWDGANDDVYCAAIRDENGEFIGYYERFEDKNLYSENCE